jgi:phosphopantetheine adenylyltransferase
MIEDDAHYLEKKKNKKSCIRKMNQKWAPRVHTKKYLVTYETPQNARVAQQQRHAHA